MNLHKKARTCPASRALLVDRVIRLGWKVTHAAEAAGVSARTAHKWLNRNALGGKSSLEDKSSRPIKSPNRLSKAWVELILELRRSRMSGPGIATRLGLPKSTVSRILKRHKMSRLRALEPMVPVQRYEWPNAGDMLHLDVKKLGRIKGIGHRITGNRQLSKRQRGIGWDFVHVCIDDATRVAYVEVLGDEKVRRRWAFSNVLSPGFARWECASKESSPTTAVATSQRSSPTLASGFGSSTAELAPTRRGRTAKLSASSKRCCGNAPTPCHSSARYRPG